jgi:hypothetical protein
VRNLCLVIVVDEELCVLCPLGTAEEVFGYLLTSLITTVINYYFVVFALISFVLEFIESILFVNYLIILVEVERHLFGQYLILLLQVCFPLLALLT